MAIDNTTVNEFGKGVIYAAPIDLNARKPLDSRIYVDTLLELNEHYTAKRCYPGMQVYVAEDGITYIYFGEEEDYEGHKVPVWGRLADRDWVTEQIVEAGGMTREEVIAIVNEILDEARRGGHIDDVRTYSYGPLGIYTVTLPRSEFPAEGDASLIYVDSDTDDVYKWSTTANDYVAITEDDYLKYFPRFGVKDVQYVDKNQNIEYIWVADGGLGGQYEAINKIASSEEIEDLF